MQFTQGGLTTIYCVLIFKIGVNQQSHIFAKQGFHTNPG